MLSTLIALVTPAAVSKFYEDQPVPMPEDHDDAVELAAKLSGFRTQPEFAAFALNITEGAITGDQLTDCLTEAFPKAKVGKRHGPYYLSKARTGKLRGTDLVPPKAARSTGARKAQVAALEAENEQLKARLAALEAKAEAEPAKPAATTRRRRGNK